MIARSAMAQDDVTGDGTISNVLIICEILKIAERHIADGIHPWQLISGLEKAKSLALEVLEEMKIPVSESDSEIFLNTIKCAISTKIDKSKIDELSDIVYHALRIIKNDTIDLHMIEIMKMSSEFVNTTKLVRGLILDHGARHTDMPKELKNCFILNLNVSLEYEKP